MTIVQVLQLAHPFPVLLGQFSGGRGQQVGVGAILLWLVIAAAAIAVASIAVYIAHRTAVRRRLNSHPGLFDALCKVHNLTRGQSALLRQVIRMRNMTYPGQIFTEPNWTNPKTLPTLLRGKTAELGKLHKELFS